MKVLLAPYAAKLPTGSINPKNYPHWPQVVAALSTQGCEVIQIGKNDEPRIEGAGQYIVNWPLDKLRKLVEECAAWLSVDSFLPHFCATERLQPGVVVWSQSDPSIWGYPHNINLIKSRAYLRQFQYAPWYETTFNPEAFVEPEVVVAAVNELLHQAT